MNSNASSLVGTEPLTCQAPNLDEERTAQGTAGHSRLGLCHGRILLTFGLLLAFLLPVLYAEDEAPILQLRHALELAADNNPSIVRLSLESAKLRERLAGVKTRRLPHFDVTIHGAQQLREVDFLFRQGVFGAFPQIGPVPPVDTKLTTGKQPTALVLAQVAQPLTQQHAIGLNLQQLELQVQINEERLRAERQKVLSEVKKAYYSILLTQNGLATTRQAIELYRELDRVTNEYVMRQVALKGDHLEVETRLARTEYEALLLEDQLAVQQQQFNLLLGRTVDTPFAVSPATEARLSQMELASLRQRALDQRPEIREAHLRMEQAELDRRVKRAEYIPDLSLTLSYFSPLNFSEMLPTHVTSVGVLFKWEVFDWGRRRRELAERALTVQQAQSGLQEAHSSVLVDVEAKYRKIQQARQLVRIAELDRERLVENVRVMTNRYEQQFSLFKDVLQAQTELEKSNFEYEQALLSLWVAQADLERALGEEP